MQSTFADLGVSPGLAGRLESRGILAPFPIQEAAIPPALAGRDIAGRAPTGSGKTLAFGLPIAQRVERARPGRPRALILAPTRELAAQIRDELAPLLATRQRSVAAFYGGTSYVPQRKLLNRGVDVLVACPGRLADLMARGNVTLDEVQTVVVDEADRMADMGFLPDVRRILDKVPGQRQTLLFSATLDGAVDVLIRRYQRDVLRCDVAAPDPADDATVHRFVMVAQQQRIGLTADLIGEHGSTLVFCRTKRGADRVAAQLAKAGVGAVAIHGDRSQSQRERALAAFSGRRVRIGGGGVAGHGRGQAQGAPAATGARPGPRGGTGGTAGPRSSPAGPGGVAPRPRDGGVEAPGAAARLTRQFWSWPFC